MMHYVPMFCMTQEEQAKQKGQRNGIEEKLGKSTRSYLPDYCVIYLTTVFG